jgi:hypothetical protein
MLHKYTCLLVGVGVAVLTHVGGSVQVFRQQYVVSSDGQRFLMNTVSEDASASPITVILNWKGKPQIP